MSGGRDRCPSAVARPARDRGFAPDGRFPVLPTLGFALGAALVILPQRVSAGRDREGAMEAAP
ncbi:hypothetical protein [Actinacidiphila oryziradicis]|uniref:Uncharacterized protein n=1 Tax=Actinacidiphila oryziradicis TaxID=2571141 RepID=A0A4U0SPR8_9ACTN|nr:hypothetical protein [Actinacidiphila oryziradicis]TKA11942.1 hypothetical protein FCI23_08980 [Actinacidiphila oryziradicis]